MLAPGGPGNSATVNVGNIKAGDHEIIELR